MRENFGCIFFGYLGFQLRPVPGRSSPLRFRRSCLTAFESLSVEWAPGHPEKNQVGAELLSGPLRPEPAGQPPKDRTENSLAKHESRPRHRIGKRQQIDQRQPEGAIFEYKQIIRIVAKTGERRILRRNKLETIVCRTNGNSRTDPDRINSEEPYNENFQAAWSRIFWIDHSRVFKYLAEFGNFISLFKALSNVWSFSIPLFSTSN